MISNEMCHSGPPPVSQFYSQLMVNISKKTVQRIEPDIKRTICKCCCLLLKPGLTCKVRIKKKCVHWICNQCGAKKTFKCKQDYLVWAQDKDAKVESLDYNPNFELNLQY